ncbi:MAG: hypothetical protein KF841_14915 [Phycisphaerae bacterium]|nr:hypothetical protein [Phycisphaerae bacterium]
MLGPTRCRRYWLVPVVAVLFVLPFAMGQTVPVEPQPTTSTANSDVTSRAERAVDSAHQSEAAESVIADAPGESSPTVVATEADELATQSTDAAAKTQPRAKAAGLHYGLWSLTPAIVAILLAIITQQVIPALAIGILTAACMLCLYSGQNNPIEMVMFAVDQYLIGVFIPPNFGDTDRVGAGYERLQVIIFTQFIGGMIGIIEANGGTRAMVARVMHWMRTPRSGQLGALVGGLVVFFDDYANSLILGPSMRPVFDKLRLSRAKLAYIVDSTAAPVASLFIGTWLAQEINFLDGGLKELGDHRPAFLDGVNGSTAFWTSIPYRTYAWLALWMVFIIAWTGRDFGPMKRAEAEAAGGQDSDLLRAAGANASNSTNGGRSETRDISHWALGFFPVATLVFMTLLLLAITGRNGCSEAGITLSFGSVAEIAESIKQVLGKANSYTALLYAGLTSAMVAAVMTVFSRTMSLGKTMEAMQGGMQRIFGAQIVLILAWGLSTATKDLELGPVMTDFLKTLSDNGKFAVPMLPTAVFLTACIVSFATGTSWGTMSILCPTAVSIAAGLLADLPTGQAIPLFYATIGAVLTGAVFGDHCSPISDTTVLSSITTECSLARHVRTQLPYALVTAVVGLLCTDLLDYYLIETAPDFYHKTWNVYYGTAIAAIILLAIVLVFGRKVKSRNAAYETVPA